jgi:uncharacterized membrane protein YsdA (DUF1294 family)
MLPLLEFYDKYYVLIWYLALINVLTFIFYGIDKYYAASGSWRIREKTLLFLALLGGSVGALLGMNFFRHKTKKDSFILWLVLIITVQFLIIFYLIPYAVDYFRNTT